MKIERFEDIQAWQKARELVTRIYNVTNNGDFAKDYGLKDQIRRAAVSIPSNIAEGDELGSNRQSVKFFYIAKGSSAELVTQAIIAHEIGYLEKQHFDHIRDECHSISGMLGKLIRARSERKG